MKVLYFDCQTGIAGNMAIGALLDILDDDEYFLNEIKKLNVDGYKIEISKKDSYGINGTYVNVVVEGKDEYGHHHHIDENGNVHKLDNAHVYHYEHTHEHNHEENHHHHHEHRNLYDVNKIIDESSLNEKTKNLAKSIFLKVAKAESKVHGKPLEEVHFHEVGAIDSIIDIVGTAILINKINPDKIYSSVLNEGHGFINCAHGKMAVPVPATSEIFASNNVKFKQIDIDTELVTPTGAAIISTLAENFGAMPEMTLEKVGFGTGFKDIGMSNCLKVYYGELEKNQNNIVLKNNEISENEKNEYKSNSDIYVIEANIDDSNGEILGYAMEKLLNNGAMDVSYSPIYMKKNRPAYRLEVICTYKKLDELLEIIFNETTTIGARYYSVDRAELKREKIEIETKYGKISGKRVITPKGAIYIYPEYEEIKKIAQKNNIPLKELYKLFK